MSASVLLITARTPSDLDLKPKGFAASASRTFFMPLALLYLSGALSKEFDVRVLDLNTVEIGDQGLEAAVEEALVRALDESSPLLAGINCQFSAQMASTFKTAAIIKKHNPSVKVAAGGMHPTVFSEELLRDYPDFDFVLKGEGEESLPKLVRALKSGRGLEDVDGLSWRTADGRIVSRPKTSFIENLDSLPAPGYHLFDFDQYRLNSSGWHNPKGHEIGVSVPVVSSRSCPNKCNFCSVTHIMGPRFRARSAGHVLDELEFLYHTYGTRYFNIVDDNFTLLRGRTLEICRGIIDRKLDLQLRTSSGLSINALDDEVIDALAEAGLIWAPLAIESGDENIRNRVVGKNLSRERIFRTIKSLRRYPQILLTAYFIIGFPEDTLETLQATYDMVEELDIDYASVNIATPLPGTALYAQAARDNLLLHGRMKWDRTDIFLSLKDDVFFIKPAALSIEQLRDFQASLTELRMRKRTPAHRRLY